MPTDTSVSDGFSLIIVVYFYFLVWLITNAVCYLYVFIILFRIFYSDCYVDIHAHSHLFVCVSLLTCIFFFFWTILLFHFYDYNYLITLLITFFLTKTSNYLVFLQSNIYSFFFISFPWKNMVTWEKKILKSVHFSVYIS